MSRVPREEDIDLDAILVELGQFGRYQKQVYCYLVVAILFTSMNTSQYVFAAGIVEYRCKVPQCESNPPNFTINGWGNFALPGSESDCNQMVPIGESCNPASFSNRTRHCTSWVYENDLTIVPEFDLACQEWKRTMVGTVHNAGVFAAIPLTAAVSDTYGRRHAVILTSVAPAVFGVTRSFCNNYIVYLVLEFLEALVGAGTYSTALILALEMVGLKKRVLGGNILAISFAIGQVMSGTAAWALPYWRTYTLAIFAPGFLFIFYYGFVEESVRWLICKGYRKEAVRIILKVAATNRVKLLPNTLHMLNYQPVMKSKFTQTIERVQGVFLKEEPKETDGLFTKVLRSKTILFRICVCSFWWVSVTMIYYGLSINSVSLVGSKYTNFILTAIMDIPASILGVMTLDRFGRKSSIMTSFFICGIALLTLPMVSHKVVIVTLSLIGKMMISLIFSAIYIYTIELFPTEGRHRLVATCSMMGRFGSMCAPQTPLLMKYNKSLPYLLFGTMAGVAGLLMLLTPETLHMKLPDTIAEAERINLAPRTEKTTDLIVNK